MLLLFFITNFSLQMVSLVFSVHDCRWANECQPCLSPGQTLGSVFTITYRFFKRRVAFVLGRNVADNKSCFQRGPCSADFIEFKIFVPGTVSMKSAMYLFRYKALTLQILGHSAKCKICSFQCNLSVNIDLLETADFSFESQNDLKKTI